LVHQALHDPLTALGNRALLSQRVTTDLTTANPTLTDPAAGGAGAGPGGGGGKAGEETRPGRRQGRGGGRARLLAVGDRARTGARRRTRLPGSGPGGGAVSAATAAGAAGVGDPEAEVVAHRGRVRRAQVDLVAGAVEGEGDGLLGGHGVVEVVDDRGDALLGHEQ